MEISEDIKQRYYQELANRGIPRSLTYNQAIKRLGPTDLDFYMLGWLALAPRFSRPEWEIDKAKKRLVEMFS
jgi:hypothetical protein